MEMLKVMKEVARGCGDIILVQIELGLETFEKNDAPKGADFFTNADINSQNYAKESFKRAFPDIIFIGEEQKHVDFEIPGSCILWDPLDGTNSCFCGRPVFAVGGFFMRDYVLQCCVMFYPADGLMISAELGQGCKVNGKDTMIRPMAKMHYDKALLGTDVGVWMRDCEHDIHRNLAQQNGMACNACAFWGSREVILGGVQGYWNLNIAKIWDAAPGALAVMEAGGIACDPYGADLIWHEQNADWVLAADPYFRDLIVDQTKNWPGRGRTRKK